MCFFNNMITFVKEDMYIRDQYIQESNDGEVLLIFWKGCTMLKPEIAQVPLVINIRQTLNRGLLGRVSLEQSWISLGLRNPKVNIRNKKMEQTG